MYLAIASSCSNIVAITMLLIAGRYSYDIDSSSHCWAGIFLWSTNLGVCVDRDSLLYGLSLLVGPSGIV